MKEIDFWAVGSDVLSTLPADTTQQVFINKAVETLASWMAGLFFLIVAFLFFWLISFAWRLRRGKIIITVSTTQGDVENATRIYFTLVRIYKDLRYLLETLPPLWQSAVFDVDLKHILQAANPERAQVSLKIGPAEVKQAEQLFYRFFLRRYVFNLRLLKINNGYFVTLEGAKGNLLFEELEDLEKDLERVVIRALALASARQHRGALAYQDLVMGVIYMSRFFAPPFKTQYLDQAIQHFDRAANWSKLQLEAQLLAFCALQLSQNMPPGTLERIEKVEGKRRHHRIITYQRALTHFYTYEDEGYHEAKKLFSEIPEPGFFARMGALLGLKTAKWRLLLYLLAQANLAIVLSHERGTTKHEVESIVGPAEKKLEKASYSRLGPALRDVRWRLLNARVAHASTNAYSNPKVIKDAREASTLAPYALDVRANLGTLYLVEALQDKSKQQTLFDQALVLFRELLETGWDPGFVNFRLAVIYRVQGNFDLALTHANIALDPKVQDVFEPLTRQIEAISHRDRSFSKEDI